ncbi:MAG: hypothetical protein JXM74_07865, partial [Fusobacteriaceae bacterium]|nr:hypothetical protein [Fusobacteriaceae bacterium]
DVYLKTYEVTKLKDLIHKKTDRHISLKIIYPFNFIPTEKELAKQVGIFYQEHTIDLSKHIPVNSKVIVMGRSINAITFNTDLDVEAFYDINFNKQYFYAPKLQSNIFPIDSWYYWWGKDGWKNYFALLQFNNVLNTEIKRTRIQKPVIIVPDDPNEVLKNNLEPKEVAWDIETSGFNFMTDKIGCLTLAFDEVTGYYLEWDKINKRLLNEFFKNKYQILASGKFDIKFLRYQGISNVKVDFDTLGCGHVLNEMRSNSLKTHAWLYTNYGGYEQELDDYKRKYKNMKSYIDVPKSILSNYATMDAIVTFQVYNKMKEQLIEIDNKAKFSSNRWNLSKYYYDIVVPSINTFQELEYEGMLINWDKVRKAGDFKDEIKGKIADIILELNEMFGLTYFNWTSNEKIGELLEKSGWEDFGVSKKGIYLVNDETLGEWSRQGKKEADLLIEMHGLNTIYNTFIGNEIKKSGYWQYRYPDDKVHSTFAVMLADSGRNKSRNPNLQNVLKKGDYARTIREFFIPPSDEYEILEADGSGFQLRIGAAMSKDKEMNKVFTELNGDMHSMSSMGLFSSLLPQKIELTFEDDSVMTIYEDQKILIIRNSNTIEIVASDLKITDDFLKIIEG